MPGRASAGASPLADGPELYCITDEVISGLPHVEQARRMLAGGARIVQLRDKVRPAAELETVAREMLRMTRDHDALLFINDHASLAVEVGADGLHIGQGDGSPVAARAIIGDSILLGYSTHMSAQLHVALAQPIDYVAVGPIFGTKTKANPDPATGPELAAEAVAHSGTMPVVSIGGVTMSNLSVLRSAAPSAHVAVIGAILGSGDIAAAVRAFRAVLRAGLST